MKGETKRERFYEIINAESLIANDSRNVYSYNLGLDLIFIFDRE